jgi:hypothetical protein
MRKRSQLISRKEYARQKGVSPAYVRKLIREGRLPLSNGKIDPEAADAQLAETKVGEQQIDKLGTDVPEGATYVQARTAYETYRAKKERLLYGQMVRNLVALEEARKAWAEACSNIRGRFLQMSGKLAQRLYGVETQAEIKAIVDAEVHETLTELSQANW